MIGLPFFFHYAMEEILEKAHKQVNLQYLKVVNRMAVCLLHDNVFENSVKETTGRHKLLQVLKTNEVKLILQAAPDDDKGIEWHTRPWEMPAAQIWAKILHKYEGMQ